MKLTKEQKKTQAAELARTVKDSAHLYFTGFQGLKFQEMAALRGKLRALKCGYKVVKNSLLGHALKQAGVSLKDEKLLDGPNAIVFAQEDDPVSPAKVLFKVAKEAEALKVKAGYVGGQWITAEECRQLSKLGTRPELLGQIAGSLYSAVAQGAWVLAAPIRDFVLALKELEQK